MKKYNPVKIQEYWQKIWEKEKIYQATDFSKKPKMYILVEFPYPSGDGLHVGHVRSYAALDALARKKRMEGYNVLYPMGWDAFGLPTENYAIKMGVHPEKITQKNINTFRKQLKSLGLSFDWSREINTTDPKYYKWTQWIFLKFFNSYYDKKEKRAKPITELKIPENLKGKERKKFIDNHRLAYQAKIPINWCPHCKIGLANEEVIQGKCERCGTRVERREIKQWMLRITEYADRLIEDLDKVNYLEKIKKQQINWIGKSYGTEINFLVKLKNKNLGNIKVFTTRIDTIFGVTAIVVAPEHSLVKKYLAFVENQEEINEYIEKAKRKSEMERTELLKEKTGVELKGIKAINPLNNKEIPVWVGDYVIATYGGGAVMVVPAHDQRDFEFAQKYNLEIIEVIKPQKNQEVKRNVNGKLLEAFEKDGILINSGKFNGLNSEEARKKITELLEKQKIGKRAINYKLRDWVFSRQHYWGEPIPLIHCPKCGVVPVPEKDLPVKLPYVKKYKPTGTGESPLANCYKWINTKCPICGGPAKRETDTMPNWAGSSWYFIRYIDPKNDKNFADMKKMKYWLPVDLYNGGMEHTTLHLLYSRFWYKFLYDLGLVPGPEPYARRHSHGIVLAEDGRKMSKSFGNVINPDEIVKKYGADTIRMYEMFMGPFEETVAWSTNGLIGIWRFLNRVWNLFNQIEITENKNKNLEIITHQTIKKVSSDLENFK
ncbi:leucine--tRNA ligase, partial [bacterium]|nr:leucine--tRNA ligase [bacterium]